MYIVRTSVKFAQYFRIIRTFGKWKERIILNRAVGEIRTMFLGYMRLGIERGV